MNVTLDGYMAGQHDELDWHFNYWDKEMQELLSNQLADADTILLGRNTYCAMAKYWPSKTDAGRFSKEDLLYANMMNNHNKIVFSKTLKETGWNNSTLVKSGIGTAIHQLKQQEGKDMIVYGSGKLAAAFQKAAMVDEYRLWVHPVVIGRGRPLFSGINGMIPFRKINTKVLRSGVVLISYETFHPASPINK